MKKDTGIIIITDPDLPHEIEVPTFTCPHCGCVGRVTSQMSRTLGRATGEVFLDPDVSHANDDGGWCFRCAMLICRKPECADHDDELHPRFARLGFGW